MADEPYNPYGDEPANPSSGGGVGTINHYGDAPVNIEEKKPQQQSTTPQTDNAFRDAITVTAPYKPKPPFNPFASLYHAITQPEGFSLTDFLKGKVTPEQKKAAEVPAGPFSVEDWAKGRTTPGVPSSPIKEVLGGMIMEQLKPPPMHEWSLQQMLGADLGSRAFNLEEAYLLHKAGAPREQVARTASPEYGQIKDVFHYPIGSKEWWAAAIPLGITTAQYAAPFLGPVGRAVMGRPIFPPTTGTWIGDKFVIPEFRFPGAPPEAPGVTQPGPRGFTTPPGVTTPPISRIMPEAEFIKMTREHAAQLRTSVGTDPTVASDLKLIDEAERTGDWSKVAGRYGVSLQRPAPPPVPVSPEAVAPEVAAEEEKAAMHRLMAQGRTEEEARAAIRAGETGIPRVYEGGVEIGKEIPPKPPPPPKFQIDDLISLDDTRGRIRHYEDTSDGGVKILFDNGQMALLYPEGGQLRVARIANLSSPEGLAIRTGQSLKDIEQRAQNAELIRQARIIQEQEDARLSREELEHAAKERKKQRGGVREHPGVSQGGYLRPDEGQVREGDRRPPGRGGGPEPKTPKPEPIPPGGAVAPEVPEGADVTRGAGAEVAEKAEALKKPPDPGDRIIWRGGEQYTVTDYNPKTGTVTMQDSAGRVRRAPFTARMKGIPKPKEAPKAAPLTEEERAQIGAPETAEAPKKRGNLYSEAILNVNKRLGVPRDRRIRAEQQAAGFLEPDNVIQTYYENEYEALKQRYGEEEPAPAPAEKPKRIVLESANVGAHGSEAARMQAIKRAVASGPPPPGWQGNQADWTNFVNLLGGGEQELPAGKLIREPEPAPRGKVEHAETRKEIVKEVAKETEQEEGKSAGKAIGELPDSPTRDPSVPPPVPARFVPPPPRAAVQATTAERIESAYNELHANRVIDNPTPQGLSKTEIIQGGRAAMRMGVNPLEVARSDQIRPDLKYGVMRAHGEDLREHAVALEREARANPTEANKARADEAFHNYSNWDADVQRQKLAANGDLAARGLEQIEEEPDIRNMVDARREFIKQNGADWTPRERARVQKAVEKAEQANEASRVANEDYTRQLQDKAPHPDFTIDSKEDLNTAVAKILKNKFPCSGG